MAVKVNKKGVVCFLEVYLLGKLTQATVMYLFGLLVQKR